MTDGASFICPIPEEVHQTEGFIDGPAGPRIYTIAPPEERGHLTLSEAIIPSTSHANALSRSSGRPKPVNPGGPEGPQE